MSSTPTLSRPRVSCRLRNDTWSCCLPSTPRPTSLGSASERPLKPLAKLPPSQLLARRRPRRQSEPAVLRGNPPSMEASRRLRPLPAQPRRPRTVLRPRLRRPTHTAPRPPRCSRLQPTTLTPLPQALPLPRTLTLRLRPRSATPTALPDTLHRSSRSMVLPRTPVICPRLPPWPVLPEALPLRLSRPRPVAWMPAAGTTCRWFHDPRQGRTRPALLQ